MQLSRQISQNIRDLVDVWWGWLSHCSFGSCQIQGMLLWQPVKFRGWSQTLPETILLLSSAFDNGLADRKSAFKNLNGNIRATSFPNLLNVRPIICEFTLLKRAIYAAIHPQFGDDLHSSPCRFQINWKITILVWAEWSAIISVLLVEIW